MKYISLILLSCFLAAPIAAQEKLDRIESEINARKQRQEELQRKANQVNNEIMRLRTQTLAIARELTRLAGERDDKIKLLEGLKQTEASIVIQMQAEQESLVKALAALQVLRKDPPPAFATHPDDALRAAQGSIALGRIVPALKERADLLSERLSELNALRARISQEQDELVKAAQETTRRRDEMAKLMNQRSQAETNLRAKAQDEAAQIAKLVAKAQNLKDLSERLAQRQREKRRQQAEDPKASGFARSKGQIPAPVHGRLSGKFGEVIENSVKSQGIYIETDAGAQVIAPYDATILYAGPFRQYGSILILGVDSRYQLLLAGLGQTHGYVGQSVLAGEPIGFLSEKGDAKGRRQLYMEIRDKGKPIDPAPWIASNRG